MQGISLSPQHPLILAYYCISMIDPTEKFVKVGLIHPIVHHLKVMELFMTLTEVSWHPTYMYIYDICSAKIHAHRYVLGIKESQSSVLST